MINVSRHSININDTFFCLFSTDTYWFTSHKNVVKMQRIVSWVFNTQHMKKNTILTGEACCR